MPIAERKSLVDEDGETSVSKQCQMVDIERSTYYYKAKQESDEDLEAMVLLDKLHMEDPTRGTRRMSDELKKLKIQIGRHHTRTLMQVMRM